MEILIVIAAGALMLAAVELYGLRLDARQYQRAVEAGRLEWWNS